MEALEYILDEESGSSSSSSSKTPFFPSLSSLYIRGCPKLKGWWRNSKDDDNEPHHLFLPSFPPSLSKLEIWDCPNLTSMPPFPYLKEQLILIGCSWKVLEQTMKMKMKMKMKMGAATTSTYFPLSQLQDLRLFEMNDFESPPEEGLRNLVSLRLLSIEGCDGLSSLHWIGSLTSLQTLEIGGCPNLTSLPQEIRNLTSLKELQIYYCPLLGQRCKRQIGEDWPFIAHVPFVDVVDQNREQETISSGNAGKIENQLGHRPGSIEPGTSLVVCTPEMSASPLLEKSNNLDGINYKMSKINSAEPSVAEQPIQRLINLVNLISSEALSASVSDIGAVVCMTYRISSSPPANGTRKMKCCTNAMPINDSFEQWIDMEKPELELSIASSTKRPRIEAKHALFEEIKGINQQLIDTVVVLSDEDTIPTAAATAGGEGTVV